MVTPTVVLLVAVIPVLKIMTVRGDATPLVIIVNVLVCELPGAAEMTKYRFVNVIVSVTGTRVPSPAPSISVAVLLLLFGGKKTVAFNAMTVPPDVPDQIVFTGV